MCSFLRCQDRCLSRWHRCSQIEAFESALLSSDRAPKMEQHCMYLARGQHSHAAMTQLLHRHESPLQGIRAFGAALLGANMNLKIEECRRPARGPDPCYYDDVAPILT